MDEIFGVIDDGFRVSIVDSTMMWIVHHAMDKAHGRVKSREGVIERLHEISKFYELAVMQLDGCVNFVQEESDSHNLENGHEEVVAGLTELRNRLERRLLESELAILQKDRELIERSESEFKLRQALEMKERELVSSQENLEVAKSQNVQNSILGHRESEDDDGDGEFCESKNSSDRQVSKVGEILDFDYDPEENIRNLCIDDEKVEEMGSDIDILKETLDITFGKMHNAIFFSEIGTMEQQIKSNIESDIISIFLKGFMKDFQENLAAESRRKERQIFIALKEYRSDLMNEVTSLCEDLKPLISHNEVQPKNVEERNFSSIASSQLDFGSNSQKTKDSTSARYGVESNEKEPEDEGSHHVAKMIKSHESIIRKKSEEAEELNRMRQEMLRERTSLPPRGGKNSVSLRSRIQGALENLENSIIQNAKVNKILGENGGEVSPEKREQLFTESDKQKSDVDTLADVWDKMHKLPDEENKECILRQEREEICFQNVMMEEVHSTLHKGFMENFRDDLYCWELEKLISDGVLREFIKNMVNQQNENMESDKIEAHIKDDIYYVAFLEAIKDDCSIYDVGLPKLQNMKDEGHCLEGLTSDNELSQSLECKIRQEVYGIPFAVMLKAWQKSIEEHTTESFLTEEIYCLVFVETLKSISHSPDAQFFHDSLQNFPITIKEDICSVFLREMVREWEEKIEAHNMELSIREEICNIVLSEAGKEVCNSYTEVNTAIQDNINEKKPSDKRFYAGPDIDEEDCLIHKLNLLSESIGVEENLMLSSRLEIMEYHNSLKPMALECESDESKAISVESTDSKCGPTPLCNKLENTVEELDRNKVVLGKFRSISETIVHEPEKVCKTTHVEDDVLDWKPFLFKPTQFLCVQLNQSDSKWRELLEFSHIFDDFNLMANEKLEAMLLRLEEMKYTLDPLFRAHASLRENESLYKKAFISRCQNLKKAENEVDLLADQVDILLCLLEKIYLILNHHSPVLQQYFDVSEILRLIKEEVARVVYIPPENLNTSSGDIVSYNSCL